MQEHSIVTGQNLEQLDQEPVLSDFYTPSQDRLNCEKVFVALGTGATGLISNKVFK